MHTYRRVNQGSEQQQIVTAAAGLAQALSESMRSHLRLHFDHEEARDEQVCFVVRGQAETCRHSDFTTSA